MLVGQKELISVVCFFKDKIINNQHGYFPVFRGKKGEDFEIFLKEYKSTCICTWLVLV
jgi:hypothetical protein